MPEADEGVLNDFADGLTIPKDAKDRVRKGDFYPQEEPLQQELQIEWFVGNSLVGLLPLGRVSHRISSAF